MEIKNFRDLRIWQKGKEIVLKIYEVTDSFPENERYGLVSQLRRASVSIVSNIAEGFNRYQRKEYKRFLYISLGSCAEIESQIEISEALKFIEEEPKNQIIEMLDYESKMISSLIKKL